MEITPLEKWISEKTGISGRPALAPLREYQLSQLRETLRLVKEKSRFYGEQLRGLEPDLIQTMDDVARLPMTYPEDITRRGTNFLCVSPRDIGRIITLSTSGTTGTPKRLYFTDSDQELTVDFFHHGMTTFTDPSDRVIVFMPGATEGSVGDLLKKGLARFDSEAIVYGPIKDYKDALETMRQKRITGLVGIPSQILKLARLSDDALPVQLKSVLLSADYVSTAAAAAIASIWGAPVYNHYGMTETGLGGAVECEARDGCHMREADLLFEIVDPDTGMPVPDDTFGEVVVTTLTRRGMPLVRYRTGDRSRIVTAPCPCGTVLRRLGPVSGRIREAPRLKNGQRLFIRELDEIILADPQVLDYTAILTDKDGADCLNLTIEPRDKTFTPNMLQDALNEFISKTATPLRLDIQCGETGFFTTGTLKRRIADHRI